MDNLESIQTLFTEHFYSSSIPSCPLCKRRIMTKHYITTHIAIYCPEADRYPFPNSVLSELYNSVTNSKKLKPVKSTCKEWSNVSSLLRWCRHSTLGLCYELLFQNNSKSIVPNSILLKSKSGRSISKQGYRLRMKKLISEFKSEEELINSPPTTRILRNDSCGHENNINIIPQQPLIHISQSINQNNHSSPLFPSTLPTTYPGCAHPNSISFILSRITLSQQRIKLIKSTIFKWTTQCSVHNVGSLIRTIESFAVSIISDISLQMTYKRNILQNMMVFLRTVINYDDTQFILIKSNAGIKFLAIELRKFNILITKLRIQNSTIESQETNGQWVSKECLLRVTKDAKLFSQLLLDKYWNHEGRFPIISREIRSLFSKLSIEDAKFFQLTLLWRLFGVWTPQRSGRIMSLEYGTNLLYNNNTKLYLFKESISDQKSSQTSSRVLTTISIHSDLTKLLDFNLFMIIPKLTGRSLSPRPQTAPVFINKNGSQASQDSVNLMLTKLFTTIDPTAPRITCQLLRRVCQTNFFAADPSILEIEAFNHLADHSFATSMLYYRLFTESRSQLTAMNRTPTSHLNIWS